MIRLGGLGGFILRAQTARTEVEPLGFPFNDYISGMNIGHPPAVGVAFRMADGMAEL